MKTVYGGPFDGGQVDWEADLECVKSKTQYHVYLRMDGAYHWQSSRDFPPSWAAGGFHRMKVIGDKHDKLYGGEYVLA